VNVANGQLVRLEVEWARGHRRWGELPGFYRRRMQGRNHVIATGSSKLFADIREKHPAF